MIMSDIKLRNGVVSGKADVGSFCALTRTFL
jgi:hypothetical protein